MLNINLSETEVGCLSLFQNDKKEKSKMLRSLPRRRWLAFAASLVLLLVVLSFTLSSRTALARPADRIPPGAAFDGWGTYKNNAKPRFEMDLSITTVRENNTIEGQLAEPTYGNSIVKIIGRITNAAEGGNRIEFESTEVIRKPDQGPGILLHSTYTAVMANGVKGYILTGKWFSPGVLNTDERNAAGDFQLFQY